MRRVMVTMSSWSAGSLSLAPFPELAGNQQRDFRIGGERRVADEIEIQNIAMQRVIGTSGELEQAASLEARSVARLRVAEIGATFVAGFGGVFLGGAKPVRLMAGLRQKMRGPQGRVDGVLGADHLKRGTDRIDDRRLVGRLRAADDRSNAAENVGAERDHPLPLPVDAD
jgi:hypothetical protein